VQGPGQLAVVDPVTKSVAADVTVGSQPHWIGLSPDGKTAYMTNEGSNTVSVVDLGTDTVVQTIPVGNAPRKIAVQP
jgi:YVTN family beta-propeller protein